MEAFVTKPGEDKPVTDWSPPTVADNLNAVADMIKYHGMLCKEAWSTIVRGKRKGCAEGLMAEQMGLYNGFTQQLAQVKNEFGTYELLNMGEILNFNSDDFQDDDDLLQELRETDEWKVLAKTILESDPEKWGSFNERIVLAFNDLPGNSATDVEMMFRKAAIEASNL